MCHWLLLYCHLGCQSVDLCPHLLSAELFIECSNFPAQCKVSHLCVRRPCVLSVHVIMFLGKDGLVVFLMSSEWMLKILVVGGYLNDLL